VIGGGGKPTEGKKTFGRGARQKKKVSCGGFGSLKKNPSRRWLRSGVQFRQAREEKKSDGEHPRDERGPKTENHGSKRPHARGGCGEIKKKKVEELGEVWEIAPTKKKKGVKRTKKKILQETKRRSADRGQRVQMNKTKKLRRKFGKNKKDCFREVT